MKLDTKRKIVWVVFVVAIIVLVYTLIRSFFYFPTDEIDLSLPANTKPQINPETNITYTPPSKIIIPSLSIDTKVQHVGINEKGNMATPSGFTEVGWYKYGPIPGQIGSAVITGHLDNALALNGVFKNLKDINFGDEIQIVGENGSTTTFMVEKVELFPYDKVPAEIIFNQKDAARLNLITCAGLWLKDVKTYSKRLIVFAKLKM